MATFAAEEEIAFTLKHFTGRSEHLESFILFVYKFYDIYDITSDNVLGELVFASICSKTNNDARDYIIRGPYLNTWPQIKLALKEKNAIQLTVMFYSKDVLSKNKNETLPDVIERTKVLKTRLCLKINSENFDHNTKLTLINQVEDTTITVLISNTSSE